MKMKISEKLKLCFNYIRLYLFLTKEVVKDKIGVGKKVDIKKYEGGPRHPSSPFKDGESRDKD